MKQSETPLEVVENAKASIRAIIEEIRARRISPTFGRYAELSRPAIRARLQVEVVQHLATPAQFVVSDLEASLYEHLIWSEVPYEEAYGRFTNSLRAKLATLRRTRPFTVAYYPQVESEELDHVRKTLPIAIHTADSFEVRLQSLLPRTNAWTSDSVIT